MSFYKGNPRNGYQPSCIPEQINIPPMPPCKPLRVNNICDTCVKSDVCKLQEDMNKARSDIEEIKDRTNVFIEVIVKCEKYTAKPIQTGIR